MLSGLPGVRKDPDEGPGALYSHSYDWPKDCFFATTASQPIWPLLLRFGVDAPRWRFTAAREGPCSKPSR